MRSRKICPHEAFGAKAETFPITFMNAAVGVHAFYWSNCSTYRWEDCVTLSVIMMDMPVGKLFVEHFFERERAMAKVRRNFCYSCNFQRITYYARCIKMLSY